MTENIPQVSSNEAERKLYRLKPKQKHSMPSADGTVHVRGGDQIALTREEVEGTFRGRVEPVDGTGENSDWERATPASTETKEASDEGSIADMNWRTAKAAIETMDADELDAAEAAELVRESTRDSVMEAIEARRAELAE